MPQLHLRMMEEKADAKESTHPEYLFLIMAMFCEYLFLIMAMLCEYLFPMSFYRNVKCFTGCFTINHNNYHEPCASIIAPRSDTLPTKDVIIVLCYCNAFVVIYIILMRLLTFGRSLLHQT